MGTVVLGLFDNKFKREPIVHFRKYLGSKGNPKLPPKTKKLLGIDSKEFKKTKAGYLIHVHGWVGDMHISMLSGKRYKNESMPDHLLTFHLSQANKIKIAVKMIVRAIGYETAREFFLKGVSRRIDAYLDIFVDFEDMRNSIHRKYVHLDKDFDNFLRSAYYGKSEPLYAILYERKLDACSRIDFSMGNGVDPKIYCRLESRMFREEVHIKSFCDYQQLSEINPFVFLDIYYLPSEKIDALLLSEDLTPRKKLFLRSIQRNSLQFAIKRFSKSKDFYKRLKPFVDQISEEIDLHPMWKQKVRKLVDGFDVRKYFEEKDRIRAKNNFTMETLRTEYGDYRYRMLGLSAEVSYAGL